MKVIFVFVVVIIVLFVVFQSYTLISAYKTEEQKYTVIRKEKDFEIRFNPAAVIATIHSNARLYKELSDPGVIIKKTSEEQVAVVQFGGFASEDDLKSYSEKLQNLLEEKGIATFGRYRFLGYNPPYQLFGPRNEIIVSVKLN